MHMYICRYQYQANFTQAICIYMYMQYVTRQVLIESLASGGEGPFDTVARQVGDGRCYASILRLPGRSAQKVIVMIRM